MTQFIVGVFTGALMAIAGYVTLSEYATLIGRVIACLVAAVTTLLTWMHLVSAIRKNFADARLAEHTLGSKLREEQAIQITRPKAMMGFAPAGPDHVEPKEFVTSARRSSVWEYVKKVLGRRP